MLSWHLCFRQWGLNIARGSLSHGLPLDALADLLGKLPDNNHILIGYGEEGGVLMFLKGWLLNSATILLAGTVASWVHGHKQWDTVRSTSGREAWLTLDIREHGWAEMIRYDSNAEHTFRVNCYQRKVQNNWLFKRAHALLIWWTQPGLLGVSLHLCF